MVQIDPESLPQGTPASYTFRYIDITSVAGGRLRLPDEETQYRNAPSRARRIVRDRDVIMSTVRPNLKAFVYCGLPDGNYIASTGFAVLRAINGNDPGYVLYSILSDPLSRQIDRLVVGSNYPAINTPDLKRLQVSAFSPPEQHRIAKILSSVDDAIERTEALIAKYQQIKAGLMHDLFTRGVTPDGHLRPPRSDAPKLYRKSPLGWIPEGWQTVMLGKLAEIVSGVTLGSKDDSPARIEVPYLRVANVQDGFLDLSEIKTVKIPAALAEKLYLRRGDVLMNEGGDFDKLGRGTVWNEEISPCVHQNHVFRVRPAAGDLRSEYLALWSQSEFGKKYFVFSSKQSTNLASINSTQLNRFLVALPSPSEQRRIEERLQFSNARIETLQIERDKLRLVKQGLMHDLLAGRVRVKIEELAAT